MKLICPAHTPWRQMWKGRSGNGGMGRWSDLAQVTAQVMGTAENWTCESVFLQQHTL